MYVGVDGTHGRPMHYQLHRQATHTHTHTHRHTRARGDDFYLIVITKTKPHQTTPKRQLSIWKSALLDRGPINAPFNSLPPSPPFALPYPYNGTKLV